MKAIISPRLYVLITLFFLTTSVYSQVWVTQTTPSKNQINVNNSSEITVVFDRPINETSINQNNILVRGSVIGIYNTDFNYNNINNTLVITHSSFFKTGENINVTISSGLQDQNGNFMNSSVNWFFTCAVGGGTGNFTLNSSAPITGNAPSQIASGDFDNDGDVDLIIVNRFSNNIDLYRNDGNANFSKTFLVNLFSPGDIVSGDIDNDGDIDFVVSGENNFSVNVYKNDGNAAFTRSFTLTTVERPIALNLSNFNNDGYLDLAVAIWDTDYLGNSSEVAIYKNDGEGNFILLSHSYPGMRPRDFSSGDIDNDGDIDLAVGIDWDPAQVVIMKNNGDGIFSFSQYLNVRDRPYSITANDFNNDNYLDFCVSNSYDNTLSLLINSGGNFTTNLITAGGNFANKVVNGDFDADGDLDLALASASSNFISTYYNNGSAVFSGFVIVNTFGMANFMISNDLDEDGDLDLLTTNSYSNSLSIYKNDNSVGIHSIEDQVPVKFELHQNYPNPFNPVTKIKFDIPNSSNVSVIIYNELGSIVNTLVNENLNAGSYEVQWDGSKFSSGTYFVKLKSENILLTKKIILLK